MQNKVLFRVSFSGILLLQCLAVTEELSCDLKDLSIKLKSALGSKFHCPIQQKTCKDVFLIGLLTRTRHPQ